MGKQSHLANGESVDNCLVIVCSYQALLGPVAIQARWLNWL